MTPSGFSGLTSAPVTEEGIVVGIGKITVRLPIKLFPEGRTLELLAAFLQAYVFAILTCIYLNDATHPGH
jgi:F0F1-type ATP synthase membrane subunit a